MRMWIGKSSNSSTLLQENHEFQHEINSSQFMQKIKNKQNAFLWSQVFQFNPCVWIGPLTDCCTLQCMYPSFLPSSQRLLRTLHFTSLFAATIFFFSPGFLEYYNYYKFLLSQIIMIKEHPFKCKLFKWIRKLMRFNLARYFMWRIRA